MAKLKATELAKHLSLEGMQMLGGYGYATEYGMERLLRSRWSPLSTAGPARSSATSSARPTGSDAGLRRAGGAGGAGRSGTSTTTGS